MSLACHTADQIFDGQTIHRASALVIEDGRVVEIASLSSLPSNVSLADHGSAVIAPGFVDLQVNGGGGVMFNDDPSAAAIETICAAHRPYGTVALLPTLITDSRANTAKAIEAAVEAQRRGLRGSAGLHLEGPHLDPRRHGAHDTALIRPMDADDLAALIAAKDRLQTLLVTVAPESVTEQQIAAMAKAGIVVSLGHTDCGYDTAMRCFDAGASMVTHLFNAMSQMGNREPGLVGAALDNAGVHAGLIADGHHVHGASIRQALKAKTGPGRLFLVTDAMATVGSDIRHFMLNGRRIVRQDGRLTLSDGTLAGADIDMAASVSTVRSLAGNSLLEALAMAGAAPAAAIGRAGELGCLKTGVPANFVVLSGEGALRSVHPAD